ncbi:MAG: DUF5611 family protein [Methanobacteriota archaeon]|nr:MAG: DUF5611 family protein [Euryarchaeota archaeon]
MQAFDIKKGHFKTIEGDKLKELMEDFFGEAEEIDGKLQTSFGALQRLAVWTDGKVLFVDTEMQQGVDDTTALKTIRAYNTFMERATGFTSKQRRDRLQKKAKKGQT